MNLDARLNISERSLYRLVFLPAVEPEVILFWRSKPKRFDVPSVSFLVNSPIVLVREVVDRPSAIVVLRDRTVNLRMSVWLDCGVLGRLGELAPRESGRVKVGCSRSSRSPAPLPESNASVDVVGVY